MRNKQIIEILSRKIRHLEEKFKTPVVPMAQQDLKDPESAFRVLSNELRVREEKMFRDGNIMMEGPLDHASGGSPSERFMQLYLNPLKLAILARYTSIGYRIVYEFAQDAWANGLGVTLVGDGVDDLNERINITLKEHFRKLNFFDVWELATGFMREQGDSIIINYYEGDVALDHPTNTGIKDFSFMRTPAPEGKQIVKIDAFSRQQYSIVEDDGQGNPLMFRVSVFLGTLSGVQQIDIHRSRLIWLRRMNLDKDFTSQSIIEPCYNELVIGTTILKATGEGAFRWGYGHPVLMTKGLSEQAFSTFKELVGNPTREAWHILPSEWVESFEMISNKMGMLDLPALGDYVLKLVVIATGIPKPIMEGDVAGVVQGGKVNERTYFALLDKTHLNLETPVLEYFGKDLFIRNLLNGLHFEYDWGLRFSMSAEEQVNFDVKDIGNNVTRLNYMTINEIRKRQDLHKLADVVDDDPVIKKYAKQMGNSLSTFTVIDMIAQENQIDIKKKQMQLKKAGTVVGNDGSGKGEGVGHGQGQSSKIAKPASKQSVASKAASRAQLIKNAQLNIGNIIEDLRGDFSIKEMETILGVNKGTIGKLNDLRNV